MTLAVLQETFWKALIVTFAYVFGMTFPLFVTAYFYDRFKLDKLKIIRGKLFDFKLWGKTVYLHTTNLFAGIIFFFAFRAIKKSKENKVSEEETK